MTYHKKYIAKLKGKKINRSKFMGTVIDRVLVSNHTCAYVKSFELLFMSLRHNSYTSRSYYSLF